MPKTIGGEKVNYIVLDDASDTTAAVTNTRKLISEHKVDVVIGSTITPNSLAMIDVVAEAQVPMISMAASARIVEPVVLPVECSLVYVLISNVVRNACAHTRRGHVQVRLSVDHVAISDTGIGIPEERFPALFQRHAKGEDSPGHGLGLSIVARICERLDWRVSVSSDEASGTTFRFDFPAPPAVG